MNSDLVSWWSDAQIAGVHAWLSSCPLISSSHVYIWNLCIRLSSGYAHHLFLCKCDGPMSTTPTRNTDFFVIQLVQVYAGMELNVFFVVVCVEILVLGLAMF